MSFWFSFLLWSLLLAQVTIPPRGRDGMPGPIRSRVPVLFDPAVPEVGPFPTDFLTVADRSQKTGLRVNLPLPDCRSNAQACPETAAINQLDGFDLQPRLRVRFAAPVDPDTLRQGIFLVWLENLTAEEAGLRAAGTVSAINQVAYDPASNTAYAKPDEMLDQHRRYALIVTDAIRDKAGVPVRAGGGFSACLELKEGYCGQLAATLAGVSARFAPRTVVAASLFTTMSATAFLEKAGAQLDNAQPGARPAGPTGVFPIAELASVVMRRQTGTARFQDSSLSLALLEGVGRVAFGSYQSPSFLNDRQVFPVVPTGSAVPLPAASKEIHFLIFLPASPAPASGHPVVIAGHGLGGDRFGLSSALAGTLAAGGFAVIAINAVGHGYGPDGRLLVTSKSGNTTELPLGGRAVDVNRDGTLGSSEGCNLPAESEPVGWRDCQAQTAIDLMQLVRAIRSGIYLAAGTSPDLDAARIYYVGSSMGSVYGGVFLGLDPHVQAAVLNVGGGTGSDISRCQSPDDAYVLRDRPVKIITVPAALPIQEFRDRHNWIEMTGDPIGYAPHFQASLLPGVAVKRVLFQVAKGDRSMPNPTSANLVRTAGMPEMLSFYRHDLARATVPQLAENPHGYLTTRSPAAANTIALAAQRQILLFFTSPAAAVPDVNDLVRPVFGKDLFEVPDKLPDDLNY